ncbi:MAG TPA: hypothetical protein VFT36_02920 [Methylomirabilota bacterium]|nr:hypothetical protein [Methylomirabilota bacterium]
MKFLVNGTLRPSRSRDELLSPLRTRLLWDATSNLVRKGIVSEHGLKTGDRPGFVLIMEGDSEKAVRSAVTFFPLVQDGWFDLEIDPVTPFPSDGR